MTGSKTLTPRHVEALKKLGFTFEEPPSKMIHLAMALRHLAYDLKEAGMKDWLKGLVAKIPGLPTKDQALKTVAEFLKKSPEKFDKIVDELLEVMKDVPISGLGRTAFDIKSLMRGIKTVTDPKVILAIIALMGAFQTADAGALMDRIRGSDSQQQEQVQQAPDWVQQFEKSGQGNSGTIKMDGKEFAVGMYKMGPNEPDPNMALKMADNRARQAGGTEIVKRHIGGGAMFSLFSK